MAFPRKPAGWPIGPPKDQRNFGRAASASVTPPSPSATVTSTPWATWPRTITSSASMLRPARSFGSMNILASRRTRTVTSAPARRPPGMGTASIAAVTIHGDRVYSVSRQGNFLCLATADGAVKWSKDFKKDFGSEPPRWGFAGSPLIEKDWVLAEVGGENDASVVAFNKLTGAVAWKAGKDRPGYGSLIAFNLGAERCFLQFSTDHLVCRRMKDGSELWRFSWKTSYGVNATTPIIQGDEVFLSTGYNYGCARLKMSASDAQEVWRNKNMRNHVNSCVLLDGYLYGYDDRELKCLDWKTGQVKWSTPAYGKGSLMVADGKLILYGQSGKLGLAEATPAAFKEICSFQALGGKDTWANPVLANGRLYVRSLEKMVAFDVKKEAAKRTE